MMTAPNRPRPKLTIKQMVLARMALGSVKTALQYKKALRRARKAMQFTPKVQVSQWRQKHPGFSRISAHGWRGKGEAL